MRLESMLSTLILFAFLVTILLAVGSYAAYKLRERRRPRDPREDAPDEPVFFERFFPATRAPEGDEAAQDARAS